MDELLSLPPPTSEGPAHSQLPADHPEKSPQAIEALSTQLSQSTSLEELKNVLEGLLAQNKDSRLTIENGKQVDVSSLVSEVQHAINNQAFNPELFPENIAQFELQARFLALALLNGFFERAATMAKEYYDSYGVNLQAQADFQANLTPDLRELLDWYVKVVKQRSGDPSLIDIDKLLKEQNPLQRLLSKKTSVLKQFLSAKNVTNTNNEATINQIKILWPIFLKRRYGIVSSK